VRRALINSLARRLRSEQSTPSQEHTRRWWILNSACPTSRSSKLRVHIIASTGLTPVLMLFVTLLLGRSPEAHLLRLISKPTANLQQLQVHRFLILPSTLRFTSHSQTQNSQSPRRGEEARRYSRSREAPHSVIPKTTSSPIFSK
jgi:hypothetical protein